MCILGNIISFYLFHLSHDKCKSGIFLSLIFMSLQYSSKELILHFFVSTAIHRLDILNLMIHALNSVLMVTDLFLVAHPFRLLHCYWPLLVTVCYIVFSYIYYEFGGTDRQDRPVVYSLLDWRLPIRAAISSVFGLLISLSIHCVAWFLFLIRKWIALSIKKTIALPMHEEKNHTPSEMQPALQMNDIIC